MPVRPASPLRRGRLRRPDGPGLRRRRPRRVPGRRLVGHRGRRRRPAGGVRAAADRQRRAGAQRPTGRRRGGRAARRRRAPSPPEWVAATVPGLVTDADRLAAMGAAAARLVPRDADDRLARMRRRRRSGEGPGPRRAAAGRPARPGALRRHRRRRALRHRPDHAASAASPSAAATAPTRRPSQALRDLGATVHLGHDAAHVADADTAGRLHRGARGQPRGRGGAPPGAADPASLGRARVGDARPRVLAVAGTHGKTTTTSLLTVALQRRRGGPDLRRGRGPRRRPGRNAHDGTGDAVRRRGRRERRRLPGLPPVRRHRHQRRRRPPRPLRHRGGLPRRVRRVPRPHRPRRVPGLLRRRRRRGRPGGAGAGRGLARRRRGRVDRGRPAGGRGALRRWDDLVHGRRRGSPRSAGSPCRSPGATTCSTRSRRWRLGLRLGPSVRRPAPAGSASFTGTRRRMELKGEAGGSARLRQLRPPPERDPRRPRGGPRPGRRRPVGGRLPAAPGLAHPHLRPRDGRGAGRGRRGGRARRLPRSRGRRPRGHRCAWWPTPSRWPPGRVEFVPDLDAVPAALVSPGPAR